MIILFWVLGYLAGALIASGLFTMMFARYPHEPGPGEMSWPVATFAWSSIWPMALLYALAMVLVDLVKRIHVPTSINPWHKLYKKVGRK